jgi:hypothetical protein
MITPAEILKKAERQYATFLSAVLTRQRFFPFEIKGNKGKANDSYEKIFREIRRLLEGEKKKIGYGYTVSLKTINTRQAGEISMPDQIYFENVEDYVKFIGKETEFLAFQKAARTCKKELPELQNFMVEQPLKVIKHLEIWKDLIKVGVFFLDNPKPNLYAREIPINIANANFIEDNQIILNDILNAILPKDAIFEKETIFEKRFGLKYELPQIRIRSLSGNLANFLISDITLSLNDWQQINLTAETVFIITDKMNFLRFPETPNAIAILVTPKIIENLKEITFLKNKKIYFWGDISLQSMEYLSAIRTVFPKVKSFLMTVELLEKYADFVETKKVENAAIITHLTMDEQAVLKEILEGKSLLQKVILQGDIEECLEDI